MVKSIGSRDDTVKQYKKSEKKWKKELKYLKKQNKIIFSITKKSGSRRELNKINNIRAASKKRYDSNIDSSSDESESNSSLSRDRNWDTYIRPSGSKEMNKFYHVVTNNIETNKYQLNDAIYNETTFDTKVFNSSRGTIDP